MDIRKAADADAAAIQALFGELRKRKPPSLDAVVERLAMVERSPIDELFVLEDEGDVRGVLGFRMRENIDEASRYGEVSLLVVRDGFRRSGYGRAMMAFAEGLAKARGCKGTWLVSGTHRAADAHRFYTALGYEPTGVRFIKPLS
jgi:GNAT superfamily N-acetyltransferase